MAVADAAKALESLTVRGEDDDNDWESEWDNDLSSLKSAQLVSPQLAGNNTGRASSCKSSAREGVNSLEATAVQSESGKNLCQYAEQVLEVYGFSPTLHDDELHSYIAGQQVAHHGCKITRLDGSHALATFPSVRAAEEVLESNSQDHVFQTRSFAQAGPIARRVKWQDLEVPYPPKQRPKSTAVVARRLIGAAIGDASMRKKLSRPEDAKELRKLRQEKQEQVQAKQRALEEAWGED